MMDNKLLIKDYNKELLVNLGIRESD